MNEWRVFLPGFCAVWAIFDLTVNVLGLCLGGEKKWSRWRGKFSEWDLVGISEYDNGNEWKLYTWDAIPIRHSLCNFLFLISYLQILFYFDNLYLTYSCCCSEPHVLGLDERPTLCIPSSATGPFSVPLNLI